ncbi:MAG TPA: metal ABC transporter permease [Alphaproteobacteria bacterium]|nr:metal ABC transporter permease [Alphaproteobacteria bacterium]
MSGDGWPALLDALWAALTLRAGWNATVVLLGTAALGLAAGTVGTFAYLRRRALLSDALSHATLPGIGLAFLVGLALGVEGRSLPLLLAGAALTGLLGVLAVQALTRWTRLGEDAAIGAVLSSFFGLGVVLLSVIQELPSGGQAGLHHFILGQTAAMRAGEAWVLAALAAVALAGAALLFKELRLLCFDRAFAIGQGWPVERIDLALLGLVGLVTVAGLQTVGLVLVVALLVIPPVAARFWTDRLGPMTALAALFGALSGAFGSALSAALPGLPTGAVIVLTAGAFFVASLLLAPRRGLVAAGLRLAAGRRRLRRQQWLAMLADGRPVRLPPAGRRALAGLYDARTGLATPAGLAAARAARRNLDLWMAALRRDRGALPAAAAWGIDPIERVLPPELVAELEAEAR